jgi:hypothetical protein
VWRTAGKVEIPFRVELVFPQEVSGRVSRNEQKDGAAATATPKRRTPVA